MTQTHELLSISAGILCFFIFPIVFVTCGLIDLWQFNHKDHGKIVTKYISYGWFNDSYYLVYQDKYVAYTEAGTYFTTKVQE